MLRSAFILAVLALSSILCGVGQVSAVRHRWGCTDVKFVLSLQLEWGARAVYLLTSHTSCPAQSTQRKVYPLLKRHSSAFTTDPSFILNCRSILDQIVYSWCFSPSSVWQSLPLDASLLLCSWESFVPNTIGTTWWDVRIIMHWEGMTNCTDRAELVDSLQRN